MNLNDFPILSSCPARRDRFEQALMTLNTALENESIRNKDFEELKRSVVSVIENCWDTTIVHEYIHGTAMRIHPKELVDLYYSINVHTLNGVVAANKKIEQARKAVLSMQDIKQIESKPFIDWFDGSKVVYGPNRPLTLYRGISKTPEQRHESASLGVFLTPDKSVAEAYAGEGGSVQSVYVSIKKPFYMNALQLCELTADSAEKLRSNLIREGYSGIFVVPIEGTNAVPNTVSEYVVFYPQNQICPKFNNLKERVVDAFEAMDRFLKEALPLCLTVMSLKTKTIKGRTPSEPAKVNPNKVVMTCPCCFHQIAKAKNGKMVHHGYQRPGNGWQTSSCPGIRFKPLEESLEGLLWIIDETKKQLIKTQNLFDNKDSIETLIVVVRKVSKQIKKGEEGWKTRFDQRVRDLEYEIKSLTRQVKYLEEVLLVWKTMKCSNP